MARRDRRRPSFEIEPGSCTACAMCLRVCRAGAVFRDGAVFRIDPAACTGCGDCARVCPAHCVAEGLPHG